jgi:endonuclease/exonuclease/phosphatase family metal-dependent hydrolase
VGQSCCPGNGCTFAVPGDPFAVDPFTGQKETPERIDYIFEKGMHAIGKSPVVFDSFPWVSDHSGVLSNVVLPY